MEKQNSKQALRKIQKDVGLKPTINMVLAVLMDILSLITPIPWNKWPISLLNIQINQLFYKKKNWLDVTFASFQAAYMVLEYDSSKKATSFLKHNL